MAKITDQHRQIFKEKAKVYYTTAKSLLDAEKITLEEIKKNNPDAAIKKLWLTEKIIYLASIYITINGISCAVMKIKDEDALNEARKSLYKIIIYLEDVVTNMIDAPFTEYQDKQDAIEAYDANQRYNLIRKIGIAIDLLKEAYGENSKWRWTFVELEGRFAAVAKNIIPLHHINQNKTPGSPYYASTVYHLRLIKDLLRQSADRYREKYELSTASSQDFKKAISYLAALRRLLLVTADIQEAEDIKRKMSTWNAKMEADSKKKDEAKKGL